MGRGVIPRPILFTPKQRENMLKMYVAEMHEKNKDWDDSQFDTTRLGIFSSKAKAMKACKAEMDDDVSEHHWFWFSITQEVMDSPEAKTVKLIDHEGNGIANHLMESPALATA